MSKKNSGKFKFIALAALTGAAAAGISYFLKYKSFNKELDEEFHDFEGDNEENGFDGSLPHESEAAERNYVTISEKMAETATEVKEAKDMAAEAAAETAKDAVDVVEDAVGAAADTAADTAEKTADVAADTAKKAADAVVSTTTIEDDTTA